LIGNKFFIIDLLNFQDFKGKLMAHFSFFLALAINSMFIPAEDEYDRPLDERRYFDQAILEMPQFIEDCFKDSSLNMYQSARLNEFK
jgi:hypothetical protein